MKRKYLTEWKKFLHEGKIVDVSKVFSDNGIELETLQNVDACKNFDVDAPGRCISQLMKLPDYYDKEEQYEKISDSIMNIARNSG